MVAVNPSGKSEERRELYSTIAIIGWCIFLFDALVLFFLPAGLKLGQRWFLPLVIALGVVGLVMAAAGRILKKRVPRT